LKDLNIVYEFTQTNRECPYFYDKSCDIHYKIVSGCSIKEFYKMLERGWRRFGNTFFVPVCANCVECKTIRINIKDFKFKKSHKRVINKNKDLQIILQKPTISADHITLYNRYHSYMSYKKWWPQNQINADGYHKSYIEGANDFGYELLYFYKDRLVCVGLLDIVPQKAISAVYTFYEPSFSKRSLGKFNILTQIMLSKNMDIPYWFPGYWIKDHDSMGYKEEYKPFDILQNRPNLFQECKWKRY